MKKNVGHLTSSLQAMGEFHDLPQKCSRLNEEFEKVAMIRIAELEDRIARLKEIVTVSDEKLMHLSEMQSIIETLMSQLAQVQRQGMSSGNALNDPDIITKFRLNMKPDLSNLESRMIQKMKEECCRIYEELQKKIENVKITSEPVPKPANKVLTDVHAPAACIAPGVQPLIQPAARTKEPPAPKYIIPPENLEPANEKYAQVCRLAYEQGLDAAQISEIMQIEKRTISIILKLYEQKRNAM